MCHLPEQICFMRGLKEINASNNMITGIPAEIGSLPKLELLRLDHNKLTALPESLGGLWRTLVELTLGHNPLTILPLSLGACKRIDTLDLGMEINGRAPAQSLVQIVLFLVILHCAWELGTISLVLRKQSCTSFISG